MKNNSSEINRSGISVVIPVYNRQEYIGFALESVLKQTRPADEIIVVDDGSTDCTAEVVASYGDAVRYFYQPNSGVSAARNTGIKHAARSWLAFLDSDDRWHPEKLETLMHLAKDQPDLRIFHSNELWIRNGRRVNQKKVHRKSGGMIYERCLPRCVISPSAVMIHREIFRQYGLFDEHLPACEDYEMWLRICRREPVGYCETPLITKFGGHEDQLSQTFPAMDRFRVQVLQQHLEKLPLTSQQIQALLQVMTTKLDILRNGALKRGRIPAWRYYTQMLERAQFLQIRHT